jgi:hypothetical protein
MFLNYCRIIFPSHSTRRNTIAGSRPVGVPQLSELSDEVSTLSRTSGSSSSSSRSPNPCSGASRSPWLPRSWPLRGERMLTPSEGFA